MTEWSELVIYHLQLSKIFEIAFFNWIKVDTQS